MDSSFGTGSVGAVVAVRRGAGFDACTDDQGAEQVAEQESLAFAEQEPIEISLAFTEQEPLKVTVSFPEQKSFSNSVAEPDASDAFSVKEPVQVPNAANALAVQESVQVAHGAPVAEPYEASYDAVAYQLSDAAVQGADTRAVLLGV